jgi:hypothetical protein
MAYTMSPAEIEVFSQKLATWSETLSDNERTFLKQILDERGAARRGQLSEAALQAVVGGASLNLQAFTFQAYAPRLSAKTLLLDIW